MNDRKIWATKDIIGVASGIVYAKNGDELLFLSETSDMIFFQNGAERFFARRDSISEHPPEKDNKPPIVEKPKKKPTKRSK